MRLLIVEDDRELREALSALLRQAGYEVDAQADGREAFNSLLGSEYDLAIVDLMLPGMNGRELAERMREATPDVKVLYVSGYTDDDDVLAAKFPPGAHFLQKPFTLSALVTKVRQAMES